MTLSDLTSLDPDSSDPTSPLFFSSKSLRRTKSGDKGDFRGDSSCSSLVTAKTFSRDLHLRPDIDSVILEPFSKFESENGMKSKKCSPLDSSPHYLEASRNGETLPTEEEDAAAEFDGAKLFSQFIPLEAQAGGRKHAKPTKAGKAAGCWQSEKLGLVMKTLQEGDRGSREEDFYRKVFVDPCADQDRDAILFLRDYIPRYYGKVQNVDDSYILLEDLTRGFHRPNVIDLKIGTQTFDPLASAEKRKKEIAKYANMHDLGFCVTDYRQYDADSKIFRNTDDVGKVFWRLLTNEEMGVEMLVRLMPKDEVIRRRLILGCLDRLTALQNFFQNQRSFAFYSSSILIIYEGDPFGADFSSDLASSSSYSSSVSSPDGHTQRSNPSTTSIFGIPSHLSLSQYIPSNCPGSCLSGKGNNDPCSDFQKCLCARVDNIIAKRKASSANDILADANAFSRRVDQLQEGRFQLPGNQLFNSKHSHHLSTSSIDSYCASRDSPALSTCSCSTSSCACAPHSSLSPASSSSSSPSSSPSPHSSSSYHLHDNLRSTLPFVRLYLIDFAHAYHVSELGLSRDEGCAKGLDNIVSHFKAYSRLCNTDLD